MDTQAAIRKCYSDTPITLTVTHPRPNHSYCHPPTPQSLLLPHTHTSITLTATHPHLNHSYCHTPTPQSLLLSISTSRMADWQTSFHSLFLQWHSLTFTFKLHFYCGKLTDLYYLHFYNGKFTNLYIQSPLLQWQIDHSPYNGKLINRSTKANSPTLLQWQTDQPFYHGKLTNLSTMAN